MAVSRPATFDLVHTNDGANDPANDRISQAEAGTCPLCEQMIPHEVSDAVMKRIAARERHQSAALEQRVSDAIAVAETKARADLDAHRKATAASVEQARNEARLAAEAGLAAKLAELDESRRRAEAEIASFRVEHEAHAAEKLTQMREAFEREKITALQAIEAKAFEDKQRMASKIADMQRQLENKTAQDLGYGPEVDLFETLKAEFPEDRIVRVEKGAAGADVVHDIYHNGRNCGRIVYDSKNSSAWRNDYVSKLRADQADAKADHAVLCTKTFPAGFKELTSQDGVLIVSPQRVAILASILRRHVVQSATLRLGNEARAQKTEALYDFIMSEQCRNMLQSIAIQTDDMVEIDSKEMKAHQAVWKRRAELIRNVQRAHGDLSFEIERIIGVSGNRAGGQ
jgi:hypothetical protein